MLEIITGLILVALGYFAGKPSGYVKREFEDTVVQFYGGKFYEMDKGLENE